MTSPQKWRLTYRLTPHPDGVTRDEIRSLGADVGACDAMVFVSVVYPPYGGLSTAVLSMDGRTGAPMEPSEVWKMWTMMAFRLADDEHLSDGKRALTQAVCDALRQAVRA